MNPLTDFDLQRLYDWSDCAEVGPATVRALVKELQQLRRERAERNVDYIGPGGRSALSFDEVNRMLDKISRLRAANAVLGEACQKVIDSSKYAEHMEAESICRAALAAAKEQA